MPSGSTPPEIFLPEAVFDALQAMSYSSTQKAFLDGTTPIYMFVEKDTNGAPRWFYANDADGGINPRGEIPQLTADVILYGAWQGGTVSYNGSTYKIRLERVSGVHTAKAYTV